MPGWADVVTDQRLGRFSVLALLGDHGLREQYSAYDPSLDRAVDLHVLEADALEPEALRALLAGVGAWANVSSRNVVAVHEIARDEGIVRITTESTTAGTLAAQLAARPRVRCRCRRSSSTCPQASSGSARRTRRAPSTGR